LAATALTVVLIVAAESPRGCEFAELVPDHRLSNKYRGVLAAIMNRKGVTQEVRCNNRPAGPGLNDVLGPLLGLNIHLLLQVAVDAGAVLYATWHLGLLSALLAGATTTNNLGVAAFVGLACTTLELTPGADRVASTGGLTLTTTVGVVHWVHHNTANGRALALPATPACFAPADVHLFTVADCTHGGAATCFDVPDSAGRHTQWCVFPFLSNQLNRSSS